MKKNFRFIDFCFIILFLLTPLIFTFFNSELFELPKMYFVYLLTIIITTTHLINWSLGKTQLFKKNFLNLAIILFLISQTISTFISIDPHTSFFGYYSRLNGGLLSLISFSLLYFIFPNYLTPKFKNQIINTILISGLLVSIYGIAQHFGIDKNLWVQDVQSRVFSTLGQPNWLAAFLVILIPLSLYKFLESKKTIHKSYYLLLTISYYLTLLFTKSKSGIIAAIVSITIFFFFKLFSDIKKKVISKNKLKYLPFLILVLFSITISNPIKDKLFPQKLNIENSTVETENLNITPSEDIRKIVWQGAFNLWRQYPFFGTGVETFAYSYYWTRPAEHNLTSEWEYLYNKAHNEYLNFLATTGTFGFITYLFFIASILITSFHQKDIFCGILALLITNLAGFSVVTTSLLLFLLPALTFKDQPLKKNIKSKKYLIVPIVLISIFLFQKNINFFIADILYAKSTDNNSNSNYSTAYQLIDQSLTLRPNEPEYLSQIAILESKLSLITKESFYIDNAINHINQAIKVSPANVNIWKQRAQVFYYLSGNNQQYFQEAVNSLLQITTLAPTDAKNFYTIAQFLESANLTDQAIPYYQKAIELKANYDHAYFALGQIYFDQKQYDLAKKYLKLNLQYAPTNIEAQELLEQLTK